MLSKRLSPSRLRRRLALVCVLAAGGLVAVPAGSGGRGFLQTPAPRIVSLGAATLDPKTIKTNPVEPGALPSKATITVSVTTSTAVPEGTVARVELSEASNVSGVAYSVTGGTTNNGRTINESLKGGGLSDTLRYEIAGTGSVAGSVQFKVSITQVTAPQSSPTPAPTIGTPNAITEGLLLTFQAPPPSGGGHEECDPYCQGGFRAVPADVQPYSVDHCCIQTPIVVDVAGDGFSLTSAEDGVDFDFNSDGYPSRIAWTAANSDDAWLALDRNADGRITLGAELFGNYTPQPASESRNGFLALAELDTQDEGGDGDGVINANDAAYERLRLWQDANHDGLSAPAELHTLSALGVTKIELRYKESKRADAHGNQFRYRAKVWRGLDSKAARWAWDVFLAPAQ